MPEMAPGGEFWWGLLAQAGVLPGSCCWRKMGQSDCRNLLVGGGASKRRGLRRNVLVLNAKKLLCLHDIDMEYRSYTVEVGGRNKRLL